LDEPRQPLVLTLDASGEQLHVDRPAGERYCNVTLLGADGSVHAYIGGYKTCTELVAASKDSFPFLRIGSASIPLPANTAELRRLAKFMAVDCPEAMEAFVPPEEL